MIDANRVLLDHALLVERFHLLLLEQLVVLFVEGAPFDLDGHLLVLEVV